MAEMLVAGKMCKDLFEYNRDMYKFDNMQVLQRDLLRLEMQVKRFELFREDIRDLVELTVGKMEMYHLVGALFMEFCIAFYVEGKIETTEVPPFSIALYYLSVAGAFIYLILAVWLSMHASISSHSFGVRLLTRYVRLPIPSAEQMKAMNPTLTQFEQDRGAVRIPFLMEAQKWKGRRLQALPEEEAATGQPVIRGKDYLDHGEAPYLAGEEGIMKAAPTVVSNPNFGGGGQHVRLFRSLQAKWQCFDAYARVSMSLGAQMILMSVAFYLINVTLIEYRSPTACWALVVVFQVASMALVFLDVAGMRRWAVVLIWLMGTTSPVLHAVTLSRKIATNSGALDPNDSYPLSPFSFMIIVFWLESLLQVAWPSQDEATLPRRFRSVLFLDVFGDISHDPVDAENDAAVAFPSDSRGRSPGGHGEHIMSQKSVSEASEKCDEAHMALRRWETLPKDKPEISNTVREVSELRRDFTYWRKALENAIENECAKKGFPRDTFRDEKYFKKKHLQLNAEERREDVFDGKLCGPILTSAQPSTSSRRYFWDADRQAESSQGGEEPLSLDEVRGLRRDAEELVKKAIGQSRSKDVQARIDSTDSDDESDDDATPAFTCCRRDLGRETVGYYSTQRLPWKVLLWGTRCLQCAWFAQGVVFAGTELHWWKIDYSRTVAEEEAASEHEGRRLHAADEWRFEHLDTIWPRGKFFRAKGPLSCLHDQRVGEAVLLLGTEHELHQARPSNFSTTVMTMQPLPSSNYPPGTTAMCGPRDDAHTEIGARCLLAVAQPDNVIKVWEYGTDEKNAAELRVERPAGHLPWQVIAGTSIMCDAVAGMLVGDEEEAEPFLLGHSDGGAKSWCLLLAGWDGGHAISVAAVPLRGGPGTLPAHRMVVVPAFEFPIDAPDTSTCVAEAHSCSGRAPEVVALHLEAETGRGRLWALLPDNNLAAWEAALPPRSLGQWKLNVPRDLGDKDDTKNAGFSRGPFRASGLCEYQAGEAATRPSEIQLGDRNATSLTVNTPNLFIVGHIGSGLPFLYKASMSEEPGIKFIELTTSTKQLNTL